MQPLTRSPNEPRRGSAAFGEVGISPIFGIFGTSIFGGGGADGGGGRMLGGGVTKSCAKAGNAAAIDNIKKAAAIVLIDRISASRPARTRTYSSGASSIGSNRAASRPSRFHDCCM